VPRLPVPPGGTETTDERGTLRAAGQEIDRKGAIVTATHVCP
jgi:hypothetical protein